MPSRTSCALREQHRSVFEAEALLFLLFPDAYEPIVWTGAKEQIVAAFQGLPGVENAGSVDAKVRAVRVALTPRLGEDFQFYRSCLEPIWRQDRQDEWSAFLDWAERVYTTDGFDEIERDYKLEIAGKVAEAGEAAAEDRPDWMDALKKAFGPPNNLTDWRAHGTFLDWAADDPEQTRAAPRASLAQRTTGAASLASFIDGLPTEISPSNKLALGSYLLAGRDADALSASIAHAMGPLSGKGRPRRRRERRSLDDDAPYRPSEASRRRLGSARGRVRVR